MYNYLYINKLFTRSYLATTANDQPVVVLNIKFKVTNVNFNLHILSIFWLKFDFIFASNLYDTQLSVQLK